MSGCKFGLNPSNRWNRWPPSPQWFYSALFRLWIDFIYWSISSFCCIKYLLLLQLSMSRNMVVFYSSSGRCIWKTKALLRICSCANYERQFQGQENTKVSEHWFSWLLRRHKNRALIDRISIVSLLIEDDVVLLASSDHGLQHAQGRFTECGWDEGQMCQGMVD